MEARKIDADTLFRKAYARLPRDRQCFLLDVRDYKLFKRCVHCGRRTSAGLAYMLCSHGVWMFSCEQAGQKVVHATVP